MAGKTKKNVKLVSKPSSFGSGDVKCSKCGFVNNFGGALVSRPRGDRSLKCMKCRYLIA